MDISLTDTSLGLIKTGEKICGAIDAANILSATAQETERLYLEHGGDTTISKERAHIAMQAYKFAKAYPEFFLVAEQMTEDVFASISRPIASRASRATVMLLTQLGFFVDGAMFEAGRVRCTKLTPPPLMRVEWLKRRLVRCEGKMHMIEQDLSNLLGMSMDYVQKHIEVENLHGIYVMPRAEQVALKAKYPFMMWVTNQIGVLYL